MTHSDIDIAHLLTVTRQAGAEILQVYESEFPVDYKEDNSPLTLADQLANKVIIDGLLSRYPAANIISEENKQIPYEARKDWQSLWLVDPLDGTKEFVKRNGEFTVNIALIEHGVPVLGIVYAPVPDILYYGYKASGSFKIERGITTRIQSTAAPHDQKQLRVLASRSHMSAETRTFIAGIEERGINIDFLSIGSSLKLCLVAEGAADLYPRFAPTMEWDTAAAHAVVLYAGRQVVDAHTGHALVYNKPDLLNPSFIVK